MPIARIVRTAPTDRIVPIVRIARTAPTDRIVPIVRTVRTALTGRIVPIVRTVRTAPTGRIVPIARIASIVPTVRTHPHVPILRLGRAGKLEAVRSIPMTRRMRVSAITLVLIAGLATAARGQQDPQWQVSASTFLSEWDYGTSDTTRLLYSSLSLRRTLPRGDLTVRVPWLDIRSEGTVVVFQGVAYPTLTRRLARAGATTVRQTTRDTGLGDIGITGRYFLVDNRRAGTGLDLTARVELPTGDETRGLGLGVASVEFGVEILQSLGSRVIALGAASITATGKPMNVDVQNPWEYSAGLGVYPHPAVLISASYEQWRPVIPGTLMGRDVLAAATIAAGRHLRILASAQMPLSEQAPNFGAGAGLALRF